MRRPLLLVTLAYVAGLLLAALSQPPLGFLLPLALGLALGALLWARARPWLIWPLLVLTGWSNLLLRTAVISPNDLRVTQADRPEIVTVRGTLCETPRLRMFLQDEEESWRSTARLDVTRVLHSGTNWQTASGRVVALTAGALAPEYFKGRAVEVTGVLAPPPAAVAEGLFDYRAYLSREHIYYQLKAGSTNDWRSLPDPPARPLSDRFLGWAQTALARGLPEEDESLRLEWAMTLGWKPALTEEVSEKFVRAATYHIFAVDGLRMAIIFGIFFGLFRAAGLPRAACGVVLLPLIWFYVALTGWPASAIRATVMLSVVIVGWVLKRPSELVNSLLAAALIILVWDPQELYQAGFQLSFLVVLCLILMLPPLIAAIHRWTAPDPLLPDPLRKPWPRFVAVPTRFGNDLLLTSFAAWVGSIPLVAYYFHIVTPVSTPANIVAVPLCALVLVSNLCSLILVGWFPAAAEMFNHAGWFLMECIRVSSHWFENWPAAYYYVPMPSMFTTGLYYALLLAVLTGWLFRPVGRTWRVGAVSLAVLVWGWTAWSDRSCARITVLPLSGGISIYAHARTYGPDLLVDTGTTNSVAFVLKPFLRAQGVNHLPSVALTHGDLRHIGGAEMTAELFAVRQVCISPVKMRSLVYRQLVAGFGRVPGKLRYVSRGDRLAAWTVLHPEGADRFTRADDAALVFAGDFYGARILLLSDLGRLGQDALLRRQADLRADIVVTGIPAASEALNDALIRAIAPKLIIVADSEYPANERAGAKLRERLAQTRVPVIYTRFAGTATIECRRSGWEVRTINGTRVTGGGPVRRAKEPQAAAFP